VLFIHGMFDYCICVYSRSVLTSLRLPFQTRTGRQRPVRLPSFESHSSMFSSSAVAGNTRCGSGGAGLSETEGVVRSSPPALVPPADPSEVLPVLTFALRARAMRSLYFLWGLTAAICSGSTLSGSTPRGSRPEEEPAPSSADEADPLPTWASLAGCGSAAGKFCPSSTAATEPVSVLPPPIGVMDASGAT
jgi:hypothetical protein